MAKYLADFYEDSNSEQIDAQRAAYQRSMVRVLKRTLTQPSFRYASDRPLDSLAACVRNPSNAGLFGYSIN